MNQIADVGDHGGRSRSEPRPMLISRVIIFKVFQPMCSIHGISSSQTNARMAWRTDGETDNLAWQPRSACKVLAEPEVLLQNLVGSRWAPC